MSITRCCPACAKRHAQLVNANCPVCQGYGTITLGAAALSMHEPATVGIAVEIAVEAAARTIDTKLTLSDNRVDPLRLVMDTLTDAGIIGAPTAGKSKALTPRRHLHAVPDNAVSSVELAAEYIPSVEPRDAVLAAADPYVYAEHERPNARGLPVLSANGHPSHTARIADPMTPGNDTAQTYRDRKAQARSAEILVEAAPKVVSLKARAAAKKAGAAARKLAA
ncbi:hypothetical protein SEA_JINKIES_81 [Arthrobacter phage Jinkies]|uniref:Uncharacterized protein n=1 Tax=Arthrobacter phage Jinkies TaxID=2743903 RepID=A0A7T0NAS4_9CAUD|nr:hypothetical protein SEA_JINKIES_81 [Arthrobacter phage Jinkies]